MGYLLYYKGALEKISESEPICFLKMYKIATTTSLTNIYALPTNPNNTTKIRLIGMFVVVYS